jgi:23S rRNA (uridine2552-2'-O)-methyltransferase
VYKLEEIHRRCQLFKRGQRVLDLGAAPGSWTLFASQRVGASGKVLAVDLSAIEVALPPNVVALQLDVFQAGQTELHAFAPYDVVISDMAPSTSGARSRDQALSHELCVRALGVADELGAVGSHFVAKLFMSNELAGFKKSVKARYGECRIVRPDATRSQSTEVFVVGLGKLAAASSPPEG